MKKNVASQVIGAQMISATDGSNFTGAVTVYVTGDGGTQTVGSVGSGACTHEGKGFHTYAPAQAETNYDHVAFTFEGTGAITVTVQIYPTFPQTGDNFARLGAPAGASVSADVAAAKAQTAAIETDTQDIQTRLPAALTGAGNIKADAQVVSDKTGYGLSSAAVQAIWDALTSALTTVGSIGKLLVDYITAIKAKTDQFVFTVANQVDANALSGGGGLDAAGVRAAVGLAAANLDTQLGDLPTNAELTTALGTADDAVLTAIAALNDLSQAEIRSAVGLATANLDTQLADLPTNAELSAALAAADDAVLAAIAALNNLSAAQVRTELSTELGRIDAAISTRATPAQILTTALTEAYAAQGSAPTLSQLLFLLHALLTQASAVGTTLTAKKLDGATTAATFTLDDAVNPTSIARET